MQKQLAAEQDFSKGVPIPKTPQEYLKVDQFWRQQMEYYTKECYVRRKQNETLVDALKEIDELIPRKAMLPLTAQIKEVAKAALAKVGKYPLPDGRTS